MVFNDSLGARILDILGTSLLLYVDYLIQSLRALMSTFMKMKSNVANLSIRILAYH